MTPSHRTLETPTVRELSFMGELSRCILTLLLGTVALPACSTPGRLPSADVMGAYRFEDGDLVSIRRSAGKTLRARDYESGRSRRLYPDGELRFVSGPSFATREPVEAAVEFVRGDGGGIDGLVWMEGDSENRQARKVNRSESVQFEADGAMLSGRLDLPESSDTPIRAGVVLVHGSGSDPATDFFYAGDFLAAHGIVTLTYDKRGTGGSEGEITFDFHQLARDAVAAVEVLAARTELATAIIGLSGYSQGAWVAPLAASMSDRIRFVIASYGLVASPVQEARVETRNLMRSRGVAEEDLEDVDELTLASVEVVASGFKDGWAELARVKRKYRRAPWLRHLRGTTVGKFARYPNWLIRRIGPRVAPEELPWHYDSTEILESLDIPMTWLLAEYDTSAPPELALPMLERLQAQGKSIDIRVFPGADHGMLLLPQGYAPGYFRAEVEAAVREALP